MSASFQRLWLVVVGLFAVLVVLAGATAAQAQGAGGTGGFGGSTAGFGGGGAGIGGGSSGGSSFGGGSFGGGSMSSSFSGSSGTSAFGVSQSNFSPTQATATAFGGGGGGFGARGSTGSMSGITAGVQPSNILGPYYTNPYAGGLSTNTRAVFGTPLFNTITTTTTTTASLSRPGGTGAGAFSGAGVATTIHRSPSFAFVLAPEFAPPAPPAGRLQRDLEQVISNSSALSSNRAIRIDIVQSTVVLRGMVSNDRDRRLAESLIRLSPGVRDVRNELRTLDALPPPPQPNQPSGPE